jgi:hypothetical protein
VPRDIDKTDFGAILKLHFTVAQTNRHTTRLFLLMAVRVLSAQGGNER